MVSPWQTQTSGRMNFTGTRDLIAVLTSRLAANNPPDIAILPNPGQMKELVSQGELIPLNTFLDMNRINSQYSSAWVDLGSVDNNLYAIFMKAANKGMIWYNPGTFTSNNWTIPETWDDLISLSDEIVAAGGTPANPWSMGVESGQASGWPGSQL